MTNIKQMWLYVKGLERRTFVERREKQLEVDDPDDDNPQTVDDVLEGMRKNLFAGHYQTDPRNYHTVNEELVYEYWCCGRYRYPLRAIEHYVEMHEVE